MKQTQPKQHVLFLCTGNSCRSQIAEGVINSYRGEQWQAFSAGSQPSGYLHPLAIRVMAEWGIDISSHRSKSVTEFCHQPLELVVTVCDNAAEKCPIWLGNEKVVHVGFVDPADVEGTLDQKLMVFCSVRDQIRQTVINYLDKQCLDKATLAAPAESPN